MDLLVVRKEVSCEILCREVQISLLQKCKTLNRIFIPKRLSSPLFLLVQIDNPLGHGRIVPYQKYFETRSTIDPQGMKGRGQICCYFIPLNTRTLQAGQREMDRLRTLTLSLLYIHEADSANRMTSKQCGVFEPFQ